jgi:hypothetical protein
MKTNEHRTNAEPARASSATRRVCNALSGAVLLSLMGAGAMGQVTNNFTDGEGSSSADQYPGTASDGWLDSWTATFGNSNNGNNIGYLGVEPHVITTSPLGSGGNYFNFGFANAECAMRRSYTNNAELDKTQAHLIEFDFRCNFLGTFSSGNDNISLTSRKPSPTSTNPGSDSTWWIKAQGASDGSAPFGVNSRWNFYHGATNDNGSSSGVMITSTNVPFFVGTNYHFRITQDVVTKTYQVTVSTTITNNFLSFTTPEPLRWRNYRTTSENDRTNSTMLHFVGRVSSTYSNINGGPGTTETNILSVDNIRIYQLADVLPPKITAISPVNAAIFHPATSGVSFTGSTSGPTNSIPASGMRLILNGVDVSASLAVDGTDTDTNRTATYSSLVDNTIYNATVIVRDQAGRGASNSFFFDTFVSTNVTVIEAENYNFDPATNTCSFVTRTSYNPDGYLQNPLPSTFDTVNGVYINEVDGYVDRTSVAGVDYFDLNGPQSEYRLCDTMDTRKKSAAEYERAVYTAAGVPEYILENILSGEWCNYTHIFPNTNFYVYLRVGAGSNVRYQLSRVTSDRTQPNQTTVVLGTFECPAFVAREVLTYRPLVDGFGNPVLLHLNGLDTLRLTALDAPAGNVTFVNFMLFNPQSGATAPPYVLEYSPPANASNVPPQNGISATIRNGSAPVATNTIVLNVNGSNVTSLASITADSQGAVVSYLPPIFFPRFSFNTVQLIYGDGSGSLQTNQWSFHVGGYLPGTIVKVNFQRPASATPAGYLPDTSVSFGNRGNGYSYGWDRDFTQDTREEVGGGSNPVAPDLRYATFTHLNKSAPPRVWEIILPNGNYSVHGVSGDATAVDSNFKITVEGVLVVDGVPDVSNHWIEGTNLVTLTDGRLTMTTGGANGTAEGGNNNKINFIDITPLDYPVPDLVLHNPQVGGSTFSFSISTINRALHVIEYKTQLSDPSWTVLTNIVGTGTPVTVSDSVSSGRLYRMRIP